MELASLAMSDCYSAREEAEQSFTEPAACWPAQQPIYNLASKLAAAVLVGLVGVAMLVHANMIAFLHARDLATTK
ncbi:hypothetical protein L7F22_014931, partial [Adiantum nelumboides]|nr:hypothetical protein [Adiantum nelumboides]